MIEFDVRNKADIQSGNFPLNHDCILKVRFIRGCPLRVSYLTCRASDSGSLVATIARIPNVKDVEISSVDELNDILY